MKHLSFALAIILSSLAGAQTSAQTDDPSNKEADLKAAQQRLREAGAEVARLSKEIGKSAGPLYSYNYSLGDGRARLGLLLGSEDGQAVITGVTPGSPAEAAGVRANDRIISIDGKKLAKSDNAAEAARRSIGTLQEGDQRTLVVERNGKSETLAMTAKKLEPQVYSFRSDGLQNLERPQGLEGLSSLGPELEKQIELIVENAHGLAAQSGRMNQMHLIRRHSELELASVNAGLAKYFGTDKGVIVLDRHENYPGIETGDVLIEIDGKPITQARDAWRAINGFAEGEKFEVVLLRERARRSVMITAPKQDLMKWMLPAPPAPPAPPPPPGAPSSLPPPPAPPAPPAPRAINTI